MADNYRLFASYETEANVKTKIKLKNLFDQIESMQRRATKLQQQRKTLMLDISTVAYRCLCESIIGVYKMINVYGEEVTPQLSYRTRGHSQLLHVKPANLLHPKHHYLQHRGVKSRDIWGSRDTFKNRLNKH